MYELFDLLGIEWCNTILDVDDGYVAATTNCIASVFSMCSHYGWKQKDLYYTYRRIPLYCSSFRYTSRLTQAIKGPLIQLLVQVFREFVLIVPDVVHLMCKVFTYVVDTRHVMGHGCVQRVVHGIPLAAPILALTARKTSEVGYNTKQFCYLKP